MPYSEPATLTRRLKTASPASQAWLLQLWETLRSRLIVPGNPLYDAGRSLFDPRFDHHPQAIACCGSERDVRICLAVAQQNDVAFCIRGGGHSFAGYSGCKGLVIDIAGLDAIAIDRAAMLLTVGGGCRQGAIVDALAKAGLHVPTGDWESVGIGGYMQGGGFGAFSRTYGMNCDNVASVRVMLADGRIVRADAEVNHDLWWAVRGGTGGNFGVVLEIQYRLRPMPVHAAAVVAFSLAGPARAHGVAALQAYQAGYMLTGAPDTLNSSAVIAQTNEGVTGQPWLVIEAMQVGTAAELAMNIAPLLALPGAVPDFETLCLMPAGPTPPFDRTSRLIGSVVAAAEWDALLALMEQSPNTQSQMFLKAHGGAINAVPPEDSAFVHRDAHCNLFLDVYWPTDADHAPAEAFRTRWRQQVEPLWNGHIYQNFPEADAPDYRQNYWGRAYPALAAVKTKYDPADAFRFEQSIECGSAVGVAWPPRVTNNLTAPIVTEA